ncbi:hypothetical protein [Ferruginibacter sp.]
MKKQLLFIYSILITMNMQAQTKTMPVTGEYYLQGVMETASGFKLNEDSSFNFFFSYGALDREGGGSWKQEGNTIIFNSNKKQTTDFTLLQSKKQAGNGITIRINEPNELLKRLVHAVVKKGDAAEQASADKNGMISFKATAADSIILLFEWCPEKTFVFTVPDTTHNYFEFKFEPAIMEVLFSDFKLQLSDDGFEGPHPLDPVKTFHYRKASAQDN